MSGTPWDAASLALTRKKCHARKRDGSQCQAWALPGASVCRLHGGGTAASMAKAKLRMMELVDPAIATIARIMADPTAKPADRLRAAENILDRAGIPRRMELDPDMARDILAQKLAQILVDTSVVEGQVVGDVVDAVEVYEDTRLPPDDYEPPTLLQGIA